MGLVQRFPIYTLLLHWRSICPYQNLPLECYIRYIWWTNIGILCSPKVHRLHYVSCWCYSLYGCRQMHNHMYPLLWKMHTKYFHCSENPLSTFSSLLPSTPLATTDLFTFAVVLLPFPECYITGIIEYSSFSLNLN